MKTTIKRMAASAVVVCTIALTACSTQTGSNGQSSDPSVSPSQMQATETPSVTPSPSESASPAPQASDEPQASDQPEASPASAVNTDVVKQIKELFALAKIGRAPGISFAAHKSIIDDVTEAWGKADQSDPAGKGFYVTYKKKNAVFGYNKGSRIFDVRSSDPKLQKLTLKQIEQVLGEPADITKFGNDTIYIYHASKQFQLKFIIPKSTGRVDHISVYSPQDTINNMAG